MLGSAAVAWPLNAHAQAERVHRLAFLTPANIPPHSPTIDGFMEDLRQLGYEVGRNLIAEFCAMEGRPSDYRCSQPRSRGDAIAQVTGPGVCATFISQHTIAK